MPLEIKWKEFFKFSFIFSILLFFLCLQTLTFKMFSLQLINLSNLQMKAVLRIV